MSTEVSSEADIPSENETNDLNNYLKDTDSKLAEIRGDQPIDEVDKYLDNYFKNESWKGNTPVPNVDESSDDLQDVIESSKTEENYNFRYEEPGADKIESHPRKVEGESREEISARKRKRMEAKEEKDQMNAEVEKAIEEIDEKYHQIYIKNGNKLTNEQLTAYNNKIADVIVKSQGEKFQYVEVAKDGGLEKSIKLLEEDMEEEEIPDLEEEEDSKEEKGEKKPKKEEKKQDKEDDGEGEEKEEGESKDSEQKPKRKKIRGKNHGGKDKERRAFFARRQRENRKMRESGDRTNSYYAHRK